MTNELVFAVLLAVAGAAITVGVLSLSAAAGWIVGGGLLAAWSWLVFGDVA